MVIMEMPSSSLAHTSGFRPQKGAPPFIHNPGPWELPRRKTSTPPPSQIQGIPKFCRCCHPLHSFLPSSTVSPLARVTITAHLDGSETFHWTLPLLLSLHFVLYPAEGFLFFFQNANLNMSSLMKSLAWLLIVLDSAWPQGPVLPGSCGLTSLTTPHSPMLTLPHHSGLLHFCK